MFISISNGKETLIVDALSDFLFEEGFRIIHEVPTSKVNVHLYDETNRQLAIKQYGY
jgi:hypothetical protein